MSSRAARWTIYGSLIAIGASAFATPFIGPLAPRVPLIVLGTLGALLLIALGIGVIREERRLPYSISAIALVALIPYNRLLPPTLYTLIFFAFLAGIFIEFGFFFRDYRRHRKARKTAS